MKRRRRATIPFIVGSRKIATLNDLKEILSEAPEELIVPIQDGRLERFLNGISPYYLEHINRDDPEGSIKALAEMLGIEIKKELRINDISVVTSVEELIEALKEKKEEIRVAKGIFNIDELIVEYPAKFTGQGKNETLLKISKLVTFYPVKLSNLTCEVELFISSNEPEMEDSYFHSSKRITSVATSTEELLRLLRENHDEIWVSEGKFEIDEVKLTSNLIGKGKGKTIVSFKKLLIPRPIILRSITCNTKLLVSPVEKEIERENACLEFRKCLKWKINSPKWRFKTGGCVFSSPAIGNDGTVYVGSEDWYLYAITPDGELKWKFKTGGRVFSSPAIGNDRTVYVGLFCHLYAVDPDGSLKWKFRTSGSCTSPAIGNDGTVYVGSDDWYLYAITPDGNLKWKFKTGSGSNLGLLGLIMWGLLKDRVRSSPVIDNDGTVYVGSEDGYIYAIYTDSSGPADSPWSMFRGNAKRTGMVFPHR